MKIFYNAKRAFTKSRDQKINPGHHAAKPGFPCLRKPGLAGVKFNIL